MKNYAIILASGSGERAGLNLPKQFVAINGKTILEYTLDTFNAHEKIDEILLVINPAFLDIVDKIILKNNYTKLKKVVFGGSTRQQSSYNGVFAIDDINANVLIHDAARPFVSNKIISDCVSALKIYRAVNVAIKTADTIVEINDNYTIKNVPNRNFLRRCQTPQCFHLELIKKAHECAKKEAIDNITDDCGLILKYNLENIHIVDGSTDNIKITYPIDIEIAKILLKKESN